MFTNEELRVIVSGLRLAVHDWVRLLTSERDIVEREVLIGKIHIAEKIISNALDTLRTNG